MSVTPVNLQIPGDTAAPVIADFVEHALRVAFVDRVNLRSLPADEWAAPGIYVLFTSDGSGRVYIGQARRIRSRLLQHNVNEKLPWTRAMAVRRDTTNGFNTAEIGYLEGRVSAEVAAISGLTVVEGQTSGDETLPSHMMISLDSFVKSILAALRISGIDITRAETEDEREEDELVTTSPAGKRATYKVKLADLVSSGLLRAGESLYLRQGGVEASGTVTSDGEVIVKGVAHTSPSAASSNALGVQSSNGWILWHVGAHSGMPLDRLRQQWLEKQQESR